MRKVVWTTRTKEAVRVPRADGVSSQVHRPVTDRRQDAVPRLLVFSRSEMKVKTNTLASAVERTRGQVAGAFLRGAWESAVGVGLREAQDPRPDWVRTLGVAGQSLLIVATGRASVWRGDGKARVMGSSTGWGAEGQPQERFAPQANEVCFPRMHLGEAGLGGSDDL